MTPELFGQITTAIGGPGAVIFLWLYYRKQSAKPKDGDPVKEWASDLREIKSALKEIETGMAVLLDRRK